MNPDTPNPLDFLVESPPEESTDVIAAMPEPELAPQPSGLDVLLLASGEVNETDLTEELTQGFESSAVVPSLENEPLEQLKANLLQEINDLYTQKNALLSEQLVRLQIEIRRLVSEGTKELEQRKQILEKDIERLERRQERVQQEMRTTFAGASQELAIRVQGFKEYLVGSLQDLAAAADQLELGGNDAWVAPISMPVADAGESSSPIAFANQSFTEQKRQIQRLIEQYRTRPDYYGPPWQLRRTFEPVQAERVQDWFFVKGGRGVTRSLGSRLQNILISSAVVSILSDLYGDRLRALILASSPERLGEWRRGLQDCLGISRSDFGPDKGIVLFESPEALIQKAERLTDENQIPLVLIDETEEQVDLALLQFPLWLAFVPDSKQSSGYFY